MALMSSIRNSLLLTAEVIFVICIVAMLNNIHTTQASPNIVPVKGEKGDTAPVDYAQIDQTIHQEVQAIPAPAPKDGPPGPPGPKGDTGNPGKDAVVDYAAIDAIIQQKVQAAFDAQKPKDPPLDIEYTVDGGVKKWRLVGDDSWQICTTGDKCP